MTRRHKKTLYRIIAAGLLFAAAWGVSEIFDFKKLVSLALFVPPYLLIGYDVLITAGRNITKGQVFDENFLMGLATLGAFAIGEYPEAVAVMLFYQVGELFQKLAVGRSRRSIAQLMDIRPEYAVVLRDGREIELPPEEIAVGEKIIIRPGERVPLDGRIVSGNTQVDTSALTGESLPRSLSAGDGIVSGSVNLTSPVEVEVTGLYAESTVNRILELVENAASKKAKTEKFITRFSRWYTPCVVAAAALIALVPPIILGNWPGWINRGLVFLVVSCPCALVISVPLSFFGGIGGASRKGVLFKGSGALEAYAKARTFVFDKTGTLTRGSFSVTEVCPRGVTGEELISLAAGAESFSNHPIAKSILAAATAPVEAATEVTEHPGMGISATVGGRRLLCGNEKLMTEQGIEFIPAKSSGTAVYIARDGEFIGHLLISDSVKPESAKALADLRATGAKKCVMLTGDGKTVAAAVSADLGLDGYRAQLLPGDKVTAIEELMAEKADKSTLVFVGDGINDAPVLARSDVGVAMGAMGSDAAIEAADMVLMDDDPAKLALALRISRRTMAIVRQNIVFALGVKGLVLILGALGISNMWLAVFADVGVAVIAILNAMRAFKVK